MEQFLKEGTTYWLITLAVVIVSGLIIDWFYDSIQKDLGLVSSRYKEKNRLQRIEDDRLANHLVEDPEEIVEIHTNMLYYRSSAIMDAVIMCAGMILSEPTPYKPTYVSWILLLGVVFSMYLFIRNLQKSEQLRRICNKARKRIREDREIDAHI